jgi:hypothetical protein
VVKRRTLQEEENRRLEAVEQIFETRRPSDHGGAARELTRRCTEESVAIAYRHIGVGECKQFMHVEIASCDSPI